MQESDVDIARQRGKGLDAVKSERFDIVVTLCDESAEALPRLPGGPAVRHDPMDDPTLIEDEFGANIDEFRKTRDAIRALTERLIAEL